MTLETMVLGAVEKFDNELGHLNGKDIGDLTDDDLDLIARVLSDEFIEKFENVKACTTEAVKQNKKCIVVNLFGAPGSGKSTGAAFIFSYLKAHGVEVDLVTEFAKDLFYENRTDLLNDGDNQVYIFGEQLYRMNRCSDKVQVIVTDSPLPLAIVYNKSDILGEEFNKVVMNCFNSYENLSYFLVRSKEYSSSGRLHTEQESDELMERILDLMAERHIPYVYAMGDIDFYRAIAEEVMSVVLGLSSVTELMTDRVTVQVESEE